MSLRIRYVLFFNSLIAIVLLASCCSIFFFYKKYKETDFKQRLINESNTLHRELNLHSLGDSLNITYRMNLNNLIDEEIAVLNRNKQSLVNLPKKLQPSFTKSDSLLSVIHTKKIHYFKIGSREAIAQYFSDIDRYIFVSALDKVGSRKLQNLIYILIFVFLGALSVSTIISFYLINQAIKPLIKLSTQIEDTTISNLTKQVEEGKSNNEINMIAKNFNALLARLNNAFENQKTFVQHASHELRTPLATMLSQTEAALNRNLTTDGYKQVLESLKEDQTDLIELTNSLLIISQYDKITFLNTWPSIRIDELLYETISDAKRQFNDIDIQLSFYIIPENETDLLVQANDTLLKSAFRNLIKNAYLYADDKHLKIGISVFAKTIKIIFTNTGTQLTENEVEKITMPFFRGKNALSKKGYGLGLSIVNRITEMHKGKVSYIAVNENKNQFIIELPVAL